MWSKYADPKYVEKNPQKCDKIKYTQFYSDWFLTFRRPDSVHPDFYKVAL